MRGIRNLTTISLVLVLSAITSVRAEDKKVDASRVKVKVTGLRNNDGQVIVNLYSHGADFPGGTEGIVATKRVDVENAAAHCTFEGIEYGDFAIAVIHDEDGNGKLKTNFVGIPKEGTGVSNNPKPRFGPPKWEDAVFILKEETVELQIKIQYL